MTVRRAFGAAVLLTMSAAVGPRRATAQQTPEVGVRLVPDLLAVPRGATFHVAVRVVIPSGWHLGWVNPGASGLPTAIGWQAASGVHADSTAWPYPGVDSTDGVVMNVYRDTVVFVTAFHADSNVSVGPIGLRANLSWGICSTICIPQHRSMQLVLSAVTGAAQRSPPWQSLAAALARLPYADRHVHLRATVVRDSVRLQVTGLSRAASSGATVTFFPSTPGLLPVIATVHRVPSGMALSLPSSVLSEPRAPRLDGVLVAPGSWAPGGERRALAVAVGLAPAR